MQRFLFFLPPRLFAAGAMAQGKFIHIGYSNCMEVARYPHEQFDKIGHLKWYFAHASVGANMMDGLADLCQLDAISFQFHGVSARPTPPGAAQPGAIYEHARGNPGWKAKFDQFHACVSNGWRFPLINVALNKLCYIDQRASFTYYINSMTNLESTFPDTVFVYTTIPLMNAEDGANYLRNGFNHRLRDWCRANGRVLFDIADIEAHDTSGAPCTYTYRGKTCQKLCSSYTTDGGHLSLEGRQLVARGFYALGSALVDRPAATASAK
jgi:hypothetical protein